MTSSGNIHLSQQGGLRVTIEEIEHPITAPNVAYLNGPPRYTRGMTDDTSVSNLDWRRSP